MKEKFDIEGMLCPTCAHRLQKKLLKLNGIKDVSVNMASETIIIDYDDNIISQKFIEEEVDKLGYKLIVPKFHNNYLGKNRFRPKIEYFGKLTIISIILFIPLLIIGFSQNFVTEYSLFIESRNLVNNNLLLQFILSTAILIVGFPILKNGIMMLFRLHANTDSLISLGALTSYVYSCIISIQILFDNNGTLPLLYFAASSAMIVVRIFGYYIEKRISLKNKVNIQPLLKLIPDSYNKVISVADTALIKESKNRSLLLSDNEDIENNDILNLNIGDIIILKKGDRSVADGEVVRGTALINETFYSGSEGLKRVTGGDKVLAGTLVSDGEILIKILKVGKETFLNSLISMLQEGENSKPDINYLTDRISSITIRVILCLAFICSLIWFITGEEFSFAISIFLSILIIGCPVATGIAVPLSALFAVKYCAKKGVIIRKINAIEVIRKSTSFVFNQTGTLTKGLPKVTDVIVCGTFSKERLLSLASSAESISSHPVAIAIVNEALKMNLEIKKPEPFRYIHGEGIETLNPLLLK